MPESRYLFICGCARSGTTALWRLVTSHRQTAIGMERYIHRPRVTSDLFTHERFFQIQKGDTYYDDLGGAYYNSLRDRYESCTVFGDKIPKLYLRLKDLWHNLPQARVLFIVRNIFDVASSYNARATNEEDVTWPEWRAASVAIDEWNESLRCVADWRFDERLLIVRYEDIFFTHAAADEVVEELADFAQVRPSERMHNQLALLRKKSHSLEASRVPQLSSAEKHDICCRADFDLYRRILGPKSESSRARRSFIEVLKQNRIIARLRSETAR